MEEIIKNLQAQVTQLQTACNTVRKVVVSPNIPISLFINGPAGEDALYLPKGRISQIAVTLIGPKDVVLHLQVVQPGSNVTEEFNLNLGQRLITRIIDIADWSVVRAKISTEDLTARVVIGFNFQPASSYVAEKGLTDARIVPELG